MDVADPLVWASASKEERPGKPRLTSVRGCRRGKRRGARERPPYMLPSRRRVARSVEWDNGDRQAAVDHGAWSPAPAHARERPPRWACRCGTTSGHGEGEGERVHRDRLPARGCAHHCGPTTWHCHVGGGRRRRSNGDGGGHEDETHQNSEEGELMTQDDNEKTRRRGDGHGDGTQENPETKRRADKGDSTAIRYASGGHEERLPN